MVTKDIKYMQGLLLNSNVINVVLFFRSSLLLKLSIKPFEGNTGWNTRIRFIWTRRFFSRLYLAEDK